MAFPHDGVKFEKGESGNPNGRPVGVRNTKTVLSELLSILEEQRNPITGETHEVNQHEIMLAKLVVMAKNGDLASIDRVLDRLEGKAGQNVDLTTKGEKIPSGVQVVTDKAMFKEAMKELQEEV
jgi:hypothetical protein